MKSSPENFFKLSIIALVFTQNWVKLRKIGVTELIFALLALEAPFSYLEPYAVAMVTGDDAM